MSSTAMDNGVHALESAPLVGVVYKKPSPDTLTKLVKRLRALTLVLLPVEVDPQVIKEPTGSIITPQVISAYITAAGDFVDALPYCLIRARAEFVWDANHNPADYGENLGRATACEVLARRIVHMSPPDRLPVIMSSRFRHRQVDGDVSDMSSTLEMAIDSNATTFLSSNEAQQVVLALWNGDLVQKNMEHNEIDYVPYADTHEHSFLGHLDPARLSVPRYQNIFRITIWLVFLAVYSQAVREPLDQLGKTSFEPWEIVLYVMSLSFILQDVYKVYLLLRDSTWRVAYTFWNVVALITDTLLLAAFTLRVIGFVAEDSSSMQLRSFQVLSFVAPFIWMKLITVFDGFKFIGTMQICVSRMLQESGIFFALLSVLGIGFAQGLYALDAADGSTEDASVTINVLIQALLGEGSFKKYSGSPGLVLYYFWHMMTALILLNVLISLFASAYADIVEDAEAHYLAFFAGRTVGMIRAPDSYVYPAPFNLIEIIFVAPLECLLDRKSYAKLNRYVMLAMFFLPLSLIAIYEAIGGGHQNTWMTKWLSGDDQGEEDYPETRDPEVQEPDGHKITKVPFEELIKVFPNTQESGQTYIIKEIEDLKEQLSLILKKLDG